MFRTALRLPYKYWERAVLDGTIAQKREEWATWARAANAIIEPQVRAAFTDLILYGTCFISEDGKRIPPEEVWVMGGDPNA